MGATHPAGNTPVEAAAWQFDTTTTSATRNRDTAMNTATNKTTNATTNAAVNNAINNATEDSTMTATDQTGTEQGGHYVTPHSALRHRAEQTNDLAFGAHIALKLVGESRDAEQQGHPPILNPLREEALLRMASAVLERLADQAVADLLAPDGGEA